MGQNRREEHDLRGATKGLNNIQMIGTRRGGGGGDQVGVGCGGFDYGSFVREKVVLLINIGLVGTNKNKENGL